MAMYFALGEDMATLFKPALFSSQSTEERSLFIFFWTNKFMLMMKQRPRSNICPDHRLGEVNGRVDAPIAHLLETKHLSSGIVDGQILAT